MGSSRARAQTHVPCIDNQILNHCTTREVLAGRFLTTEPPGKSWQADSYPLHHQGSPSSWLLSSISWLPSKQSCLLGKTAGLAGALAGGREPIPLMCSVSSGSETHSLLSCQTTTLDPVELAGVLRTPMSLCVNCLSLASSLRLLQKRQKKLMAVNDWDPLVLVLFMHNFDRLSPYWEMACLSPSLQVPSLSTSTQVLSRGLTPRWTSPRLGLSPKAFSSCGGHKSTPR